MERWKGFIGKDILKLKRGGLTDDDFEMLAFLKGNLLIVLSHFCLESRFRKMILTICILETSKV